MRLPKEESSHFPVLLFVGMLTIAVTRIQGVALIGMGRNLLWVYFASLGPIWLGVWCLGRITLRHRSFMLAVRDSGSRLAERAAYLIYGLYFLGFAVFLNFTTGDFISKALLTGSPSFFIHLEMLLSTLAGMFSFRSMARYAHILLLFVVPFFMLVSLTPILGINHWDALLPLWSLSEMKQPATTFCRVLMTFAPLAALALVRDPRGQASGRSIVLFTFLVSALLTFLLSTALSNFGLKGAEQFIYLNFSILNAVRIENFVFERIVFLWFLYWKYMEFLAGAFLLRCAARGLAGTFGRPVQAWWLLATGALMAAVFELFYPPGRMERLSAQLGYASFVILVVIPFGVWLWTRGKGGNRT